MRLREKGKKEGEVVTLGWDEAQAALQAGTHEIAEGGEASEGDAPKEASKADQPPADEHDTKPKTPRRA